MNKKTIYTLIGVIALIIIAGALWSYSGQEEIKPAATEPTEITIVLPVMPWSWWSMFYAAENQEYYTDEGLDVNFIYAGEGGYGVIKQVAAGQAQFGFAGGDTLMVARSNNLPVVTIYQEDHSTMWNLIAKKDSGINTLSDLEGKTIAINGPGSPLHIAAKAMLKKEGVDYNSINWVPVGGSGVVPTLISGSADAITGHDMYTLVLEKKGIESKVWHSRDYGVDLTSMGILCSEDTIENSPELIEKFVRASNRGLEYAIANPEKVVDDYIKNFNPTADRELELKLWKIVVDDLIKPDKYSLGSFNKDQWVMTQNTLFDLGIIDKKTDISKMYTDKFLPE